MRKEIRKQQILKRKNFFPTLLITIFLWVLLATLIYFIDPGTIGAIPVFFILVFTCLLFTFSLIFAASRRGFIASISLTIFLALAYLGVGNFLNLILIVAIAVCIELYLARS